MSKQEYTRLREIADIFSGYAFKANDMSELNDGIPILKIANIQNNKVLKMTNSYLPCDIMSTKLNKYRLAKNDFLVAMTGEGSVGKIGKMIKKDQEYLINQRVGIVRVNTDKCNPDYIFHYCRLKHYGEYLYNIGIGAGQPNISPNDIGSIFVNLPSYPTQTRIASILSAYDDAIENNNRRIALLEKAARELYREWFVRFRFPGYKDKRFVNGLPEGWERVKFKGNISYFTGKLDSNEMVTNGQYNFYTCAKVVYKTDSYCFDGECVLLGGNNATGDFSLFYANEKLDAYQRTYIVTPLSKRLSCPYIYFVLEDYLHHFKVSSTGAATKFLTKRMLDNFSIVLPSQQLSEEYYKIAKTMFDEKINLQLKTQNLARQRDLLLPRLMSGKLGVQ